AFATGFNSTEFHSVLRHFRHVDRVVEGHQAAVAHHGRNADIGFVVERDIPLRLGQVSAQRSADLDGAQWAAGGTAASEIVKKFAQGDAEGALYQATLLEVAGQLEGQRATRAAHAVVAVVSGAFGKDNGHRSQRDDVVDDRGLAEQTLYCRQWRLSAHLSALAF